MNNKHSRDNSREGIVTVYTSVPLLFPQAAFILQWVEASRRDSLLMPSFPTRDQSTRTDGGMV